LNGHNFFREYDFEHPSIMFILEDMLKGSIWGIK
jgi:hypothetical protein